MFSGNSFFLQSSKVNFPDIKGLLKFDNIHLRKEFTDEAKPP